MTVECLTLFYKNQKAIGARSKQCYLKEYDV